MDGHNPVVQIQVASDVGDALEKPICLPTVISEGHMPTIVLKHCCDTYLVLHVTV